MSATTQPLLDALEAGYSVAKPACLAHGALGLFVLPSSLRQAFLRDYLWQFAPGPSAILKIRKTYCANGGAWQGKVTGLVARQILEDILHEREEDH